MSDFEDNDGEWSPGPAGKKSKSAAADDGWGSAVLEGEGEENAEGGDEAMEPVEEEPKKTTLTRQESYNILELAELRGRQQKIIADAAEELALSTEEAGCLLRHYGWSLAKVTADWYKSADAVRTKIGLSKRTEAKSQPSEVQCLMAFCDKVPLAKATQLACGHWLCNDCWAEFLGAQIHNGRGCVFTQCPGWRCQKKLCQHSVKMGCKCEEMVPDELFRKFVTDKESLQKYDRWLLDSFVEGTKALRWCPKPGCERAVYYEARSSRDIKCTCGMRFCFLCRQEAHLPSPCDLAKKYKDKGSTDLATEQLLAATTKKCPKCDVLITKNKACNHMSCAKCRHQFCWLCKGDWKEHGSQTGGYYVCKKYNDDKEKGVLSEEEQKMVDTQKFMQSISYQKYLYYRTRFDHHNRAAAYAQKNIIDAVENKVSDLKQFAFLIDAGRRLIEARHVLQWTFCMAYFLKDGPDKKRFEYQLDILNNFTEELQDMIEKAEKQFEVLVDKKGDILKRTRQIDEFRKKMLEVTENSTFETLLMNDFGGKDDGSWICTLCQTTHSSDDEKKAAVCKKCQACKRHGEPACRVPECAPPGGLH